YGFMERTNVDAAYRKLGVADQTRSGYTLQDMVDTLAELPLEFSPGTRWNYSVATDVVGHLIEVISGQRLDAYLRERVLAPLGMRDTSFVLGDHQVARFAANYERQGDSSLKMIDDPDQSSYRKRSFFSGGGGLLSTAPNYFRFPSPMQNLGAAAAAQEGGADDDEPSPGRSGPDRPRPGRHVHGDGLRRRGLRARLLRDAVAGAGPDLGLPGRVRVGGRGKHRLLDRSRGGPDRDLHDPAHALLVVSLAPRAPRAHLRRASRLRPSSREVDVERLICGPPQSKRNGDSPRWVNHRIDEDPDLSLVSPIVGRAIALMAATTPRGPNGHEMLKGKEQDLNTRIAFAEAINFDTRYYNQRLQKEMTDLE